MSHSQASLSAVLLIMSWTQISDDAMQLYLLCMSALVFLQTIVKKFSISNEGHSWLKL